MLYINYISVKPEKRISLQFRKGTGTRDQTANISWIIEKKRGLKKKKKKQKTSISALLTMPKPLTVWITIKCGKF